MGDLPEPRYHSMEKDNTSVMTKVTATLGRNFIKSKEFRVIYFFSMFFMPQILCAIKAKVPLLDHVLL